MLTFSGYPTISKLQSDCAILTMEAEFKAFLIVMKDLLPLKQPAEAVATAVDLPIVRCMQRLPYGKTIEEKLH